VRAIVLLADAAVADEGSGKVHLLGVGWSITGSPLPAHAVVALVEVPWDQTNRQHTVRFSLLAADGGPVLAPAARTGEPVAVAIEGKLEVGRPAGIPHGSIIDAPFVVPFPAGLPLAPGRYVWQLEINDERQETWSAGFLVR
jgi:hypothetical protein